MTKDYAIVMGLYGINSLGTIRSLGREGIKISGAHLNNNRPPHAYNSKYLERKFLAETEEQFLENLIKITEEKEGRGIIYPTGDDYLLLCNRNRALLERHFIVPQSKNYPIEKLMNKHDVLSIAKKSGFLIPEHCRLSEEQTMDLRYPIIVKPFGIDSHGKANIYVFENKKELENKKSMLLDQHEDMVAEEFIQNDITDHFEVHTGLLAGKVVISMMLQKLRYFTIGEVPTGSFIQSTFVPKLLEPSHNFTNEVQFSGPIDINLIRKRATNDFYFIEANYRTSANLMLDTTAGINLPAMLFFDQTGNRTRAMELASNPIQTGIRWIDEGKDWESLTSGRTNLIEYAYSLRKLRSAGFFDCLDPLPFLKAVSTGTIKFKSKIREGNL